jgi:hypothetical protein
MLNFYKLELLSNVIHHPIQLVQVLLMKFTDVSQEVSLGLLSLDGHLELQDLHGVVGGESESCCGSHEGGHVPLAKMAFVDMRETHEKVLKKLKNFVHVAFV